MQVCTSLHTDNHASTSLLSFLQAGCPSCRPTNSVKALRIQKAKPLAAGGTPLGKLTSLPKPGSRPSSKLHPRSQHFGLPASALGAEATEGPKVTAEPGPTRALLRHCSIRALATPWSYFLQLSLSSVILTDSSMGSLVHILMMSIQAVRGLPRLRAPGIVPRIISFSRQLPCFLTHTAARFIDAIRF